VFQNVLLFLLGVMGAHAKAGNDGPALGQEMVQEDRFAQP
jgi:hypothetical protein